MKKEININEKNIGDGYPVYFIADIGANHEGDLEKAKDLIWLCGGKRGGRREIPKFFS